MMGNVALRKLFLRDGGVVKVGDTVPGFEEWSEEEREVHIRSGFVKLIDSKTGKDAPHPTKLDAATPHAASTGQRKASRIRRKG